MSDLDPKVVRQLAEAIKGTPRKQVKGIAKTITLVIIIVTFGIGILGSFVWANFNMDAFVKFLPVFALLFVPIIVSIGANSVAEKVSEKKKEEEETTEIEKKVVGK